MLDMTIGQRITIARELAGLKKNQLAKLVGVSPPAVTQWETDDTTPGIDRLSQIAEATGCTVSMLTGDEPFAPAPRSAKPAPSPVARIPEIDVRGGMGGGGVVAYYRNGNDASGCPATDEFGNPVTIDDVKMTWDLPSDYVRHELRILPSKAYLIEVKGDSMSPTLESGDRVMIDTADVVPTPGGVFAVWDGLGLVVKRIEHVPNSDPPTVRIISDNPHHSTYERTLDEARIVGRAVWFGRRM